MVEIATPANAPTDPLDAWEALAVVEETLPSGMRVRLDLPSATELIIRGLLPNDLITAVMKAKETEEGGDAERVVTRDVELGMALFRQMAEVAAASIRAIWHEGAWVTVTVTAERFNRLPTEDKAQLQDLAFRKAGFGEVGIRDLVPFRDGPGGDDGGDDGGAVQPTPGDAPRDQGSGDRVRPRRRARPSAQPG